MLYNIPHSTLRAFACTALQDKSLLSSRVPTPPSSWVPQALQDGLKLSKQQTTNALGAEYSCHRPDRNATTLLSCSRYWTEWLRVRWSVTAQAKPSHAYQSFYLNRSRERCTETCGHRYHPLASPCGGPQYLQGGSPSVAKAWLSNFSRKRLNHRSQVANQAQKWPPQSSLTIQPLQTSSKAARTAACQLAWASCSFAGLLFSGIHRA